MSYTGAKRKSYTANMFVVIHFITDLHRLKIRSKDTVEELTVT